MEHPRWLSVLLVAFISIPALGSECSICKKLNNGRLLDCLEVCKSASQTECPDLGELVLNISGENKLLPRLVRVNSSQTDGKVKAEKRRSYLMEHFRWSKPHRNKTKEPRAGSHSAKRGYSMEHFRWGKPPRYMTPGSKSSKRSPYAIEHFRWSKPSGGKRKPVKIFSFPMDNGGSPEAIFHPQSRRHLTSKEDVNQIQARPQGMKTRLPRGSPQIGNVDAKNPPRTLVGIFKGILLNDVQRIMG
ncbi:pro-opiomelanocortin-like [Phycodurus eques]|uniref:pro-opiomelanocortin-like n=1 Tax=Phycodurus eques TaxID=693459 RepID=UPI002ACD7825|nr:pro-opiomelanocortin-like [Phycodurus eques]XP_061559799.1 pro-opiomelanocortin-like [Phycodurus eques]